MPARIACTICGYKPASLSDGVEHLKEVHPPVWMENKESAYKIAILEKLH
jgi:hypothetical protein